jgi:PAS domain S-box-containing protein
MAPNTATCFMLLAPAIAALHKGTRLGRAVAQICGTLVLAISLLSLLGYFYQVPEFYGPWVNYTPMAIHTAVSFFVLALSVLYASPDRGLIGVFTTRLAGSYSALVLIPAILVVPTIFGYLRLRGRWGEAYPIEFDVALLILAIIVILFTLTWLNARALNRQHAQLLESESQLASLNKQLESKVDEKTSAILRTEGRLQHVLNAMLEGIQIIDRNWVYLFVNEAVSKQAQKPISELMGKRVLDLYPGVENTELFSTLMHTMQHRVPQHLETPFEHPDGRIDWYEMSIQPIPEGIFILTIDITERHKARAALVEANERLELKVAERTSQLKDINAELEAFSYSVSHDLKGPLHTLEGYAAMLEEMTGNTLTPEALEVLVSIRAQIKRMERLIQDLLDLAKLGTQAIKAQWIDMRALANTVVAEASHRAFTTARVEVQELHETTADKELLRQVFYNLIGNALKYSSRSERPHVEIYSEQNERETIYHVRDNGVGYDMAFADKLFSPFQRLHKASDYEGSGIGLAIVQRIVHKHGGRVWAISSPGNGATFSFSIPRNLQVSAE